MSVIASKENVGQVANLPGLRAGWQPAPRTRDIGTLLALVTLSGFLFFYGLDAGELYRTESLRAIIAQGFLRSGNWVVPMLYGKPLLTKPPGMYAAIALVSWPLGRVTQWTARLPSALAATFLVFLFYWYWRRHFGRRGGFIAALVLPLQLMWLDKATAAEIDMLQVAWVAGAIIFLLRALEYHDAGAPYTTDQGWRWWLAALFCVAGGFLTKWTAPAFFYLTLLPLLWRRRQLRLVWCRQHVVSAALAGLVCLAWIVAAVYSAGWDVFYNTVSREALMRLSPSHHHRPYPWRETLAHPFLIFVATLPCSLVALSALRPGFAERWDEPRRRLLQALHCWIWPNMLFWSLAPEHSVRHGAPLFTGIAGLAVFVWMDWFRRAEAKAQLQKTFDDIKSRIWNFAPRSPRWLLVSLVLIWLLLKVLHVHAVVAPRSLHRQPREKGQRIAALVPVGEMLYLFRLKDEGIMFYYGGTVRRLPGPEQLPSTSKPLYCILDATEWGRWERARPATALLHLEDEQGAPIVLVRVTGSAVRGNHGP